MLAFFCLGARYRPWRYFAALHSRVFGDGAAPRRTRCSPQPRQHSVFRASDGGVLRVLPSVSFFCGEGGSYLVRGESRRSSMARSSRNAFPSVRRRQDCALMRPWPDWQWQYSRAVRSRGSCRGKIPPRCVPGRHSVTSFALHASRKWPRTRKGGASWQDSHAMHPK